MSHLISRIRKPVKRADAEQYLLYTLLSFAASVTITRIFLHLTGYPQVGRGHLHIAHLLWGGLLLFIAALLPIIFANRWAYGTGSLLCGAGVGLFIDEVGKFITRNNDYFYPAAAPIIYAFFLLTVLVYLRVRRTQADDPRSELYHVFDDLQEVLDHDLDEEERAELEARLRRVAQQKNRPDLVRLAGELQRFLASDSAYLVTHTPTLWERWTGAIETVLARFLTPARLRAVLIGGLGILGLHALVEPVVIGPKVLLPGRWTQVLPQLIDRAHVTGVRGLIGFRTQLTLELAVGTMLVAGAVLLAVKRDRIAVALGYYGLLLYLTTADLLRFFFDQFSTIALAVAQFLLLLGVIRYRRHHMIRP